MNTTIFFIAILLAAYLYDQGYGAIGMFLALCAIVEHLIVPWRRDLRRNRKARQKINRERDGVAKGEWQKMEPGTKRVWHRYNYGSDEPDQ